jgi:hypothetical protein
MNNGTYKMYRKDAVDVNQVENYRYCEQAIPPKLRHGKDCGGRVRLSRKSPLC